MNTRNTNSIPVPRRWTCALLLAVSLLGISAADRTLAQGATVRIEPSAAAVEAGNTVTVQVLVADVTDLMGCEVHLAYDPTYVDVVDANPDEQGVQVQLGPFLSPDFVVQNGIDPATGRIDVAFAAMAADSAVSGNGVVATITFQGKTAGTSPLTFVSVILADTDGHIIAVSTQDGQVAVGGSVGRVAADPPPAAGILAGLAALAIAVGLVFLVLRARRPR